MATTGILAPANTADLNRSRTTGISACAALCRPDLASDPLAPKPASFPRHTTSTRDLSSALSAVQSRLAPIAECAVLAPPSASVVRATISKSELGRGF